MVRCVKPATEDSEKLSGSNKRDGCVRSALISQTVKQNFHNKYHYKFLPAVHSVGKRKITIL